MTDIAILRYIVGSFIGDWEGGCGFIIRRSDRTEGKCYVDLPAEVADVSVAFESPPISHKGRAIPDNTPLGLCVLYFAYLREVVDFARKRYQNTGNVAS